MKARQVFPWFALVVGVAAGCRGVLGIEELTVETDGGAVTADAAGDAVASDSATDAPSSSNATRGTMRAMECRSSGKNGPMCLQCCRESSGEMNSGGQLESFGRMTACICSGAGGCSVQCATAACAMPPGPGGGECGGCVDNRLAGGASECVAARNSCKQSMACAFMAACFEGCTN